MIMTLLIILEAFKAHERGRGGFGYNFKTAKEMPNISVEMTDKNFVHSLDQCLYAETLINLCPSLSCCNRFLVNLRGQC